jgi:hypothetical protein
MALHFHTNMTKITRLCQQLLKADAINTMEAFAIISAVHSLNSLPETDNLRKTFIEKFGTLSDEALKELCKE